MQSRSRLARLRSPAAIVAYGLRDEELELALALGADAVVNVATADAEAETSEPRGATSTSSWRRRVRSQRWSSPPGSRARAAGSSLLGIAGQGQELTLPADRIALRDLSVLGSVGYTTAAWARMVGLLRDRLVDLDSIVTHRFPLEQFEDAFALMDDRRGVVGKIVLEHAI